MGLVGPGRLQHRYRATMTALDTDLTLQTAQLNRFVFGGEAYGESGWTNRVRRDRPPPWLPTHAGSLSDALDEHAQRDPHQYETLGKFSVQVSMAS